MTTHLQMRHGDGLKFSLLAVVMVLSACSGREITKDAPDEDLVTYNLKIEMKDGIETAGEKGAALKALSLNHPVSFTKLTNLFADKHAIEYTQRGASQGVVGSRQNIIETIAKISPINQNDQRGKLKVFYELELTKKLRISDLTYDRDKVNVLDVLEAGTMQCYSGTSVYQLVRRQLGARRFRASGEVVIFTPGHMLPGAMVSGPNGYSLVGVETTQKGGARRDFGLAKDLQFDQVRVIDAELFLIQEIFGDVIKNQDELVQQARRLTAAKYGIQLPAEISASSLNGSSLTPGQQLGLKQLNESLFAFGESNVSAGPHPRSDSGDNGEGPDLQRPLPLVQLLQKAAPGKAANELQPESRFRSALFDDTQLIAFRLKPEVVERIKTAVTSAANAEVSANQDLSKVELLIIETSSESKLEIHFGSSRRSRSFSDDGSEILSMVISVQVSDIEKSLIFVDLPSASGFSSPIALNEKSSIQRNRVGRTSLSTVGHYTLSSIRHRHSPWAEALVDVTSQFVEMVEPEITAADLAVTPSPRRERR